jgi:hypothetical protein
MHLGRMESGKPAWDLGKYLAHLQAIKSVLPETLYSFASDPKSYSLGSHTSLHDSWLNSLRIDENASGSRSENRWVDISLELLGPYHDFNIVLKYFRVSEYSIELAKARNGHGDLLIHEVDAVGEGKFLHNLSFATGGRLRFIFEDFSYSVMPIDGI